MARKNIVFFVLIICKNTIVFAGYDPRGNDILALVPLAFFSQYINPDWLFAFPTGKIGGQEAKVQQSDAGNQKDSNSRTTVSQDSFRNQHSDDDGDDKPPLPPKENKKEPCGAECLPFPLRKVIQVGQAPISFTYGVNKEDLLTPSGNSPWCQIPLTQGATFVQVSLYWYIGSNQELSLWALARTSAPLPFAVVLNPSGTAEKPESSSDTINLEGEFPSSSQSALSELQVEIQLLDDSDQILSNITFINFNNFAPYFQAFNPLGIDNFEMYNHQSNIHRGYFNNEATVSNAPPFPDCQECQSIDNARSNYRQWLENLNRYVKGNEVLNFRIIIKHKGQ